MINTVYEDPLKEPIPGGFDPHLIRRWKLATLVTFAATTLYYLIASLHWRIMGDAAVMHTVIFLMRHGRAPYTQISDNNMPGAYFVEALGMWIFGVSDMGWRFFEFVVLGILTVALVDIGRRWDAFAGVFAAGLFVVLHSAEGPQYAAERELIQSMLLVVACALLFRAVERNNPAYFASFGVATGVAVSIKPTCLPIAVGALVLASIALSRQGKSFWPALGFSLVGFAAIIAADVAFLVHFHALGAFWFILRHVIPAYAEIGTPMPMRGLLIGSIPKLLCPILLASICLGTINVQRQGRWTWEHGTIVLGTIFGLVSYLVQRKGFLHHRYTFEIFLLLLIGIETFSALRNSGRVRVVAELILLFTLAFAVPRTLLKTVKVVGHSDLELALQDDLHSLSNSGDLQDKVQCFDLVYGCLDALYHLRLVENSSFTGDLLFFPSRDSVATEYYRKRYWSEFERDPPEVIVLTNQNLAQVNSFEKTQRWPELSAELANDYVPVLERHFPYEHFGGRFLSPVPSAEEDSYRLYLRENSLLRSAAAELSRHRYPGQS